MSFNLDDLDHHIATLRSTLRFFSDALERTDHNSPDWLAPDLISLRNQSSRLHDAAQTFRTHLESSGLAGKKVARAPPPPPPLPFASRQFPGQTSRPQTPKLSNSRLSLEGTMRNSPASTPLPPSPQTHARVPTPIAGQTAQAPSPSPREEYTVERVDVTEEVQRRLREARLRRLRDEPSTSHKRKFGAYEGVESSSGDGSGPGGAGAGAEGAKGGEADEEGGSARKRMRASGRFESISEKTKRKEGGITLGWEEVGRDVRGRAKRARR